jgi:hypothetical protein
MARRRAAGSSRSRRRASRARRCSAAAISAARRSHSASVAAAARSAATRSWNAGAAFFADAAHAVTAACVPAMSGVEEAHASRSRRVRGASAGWRRSISCAARSAATRGGSASEAVKRPPTGTGLPVSPTQARKRANFRSSAKPSVLSAWAQKPKANGRPFTCSGARWRSSLRRRRPHPTATWTGFSPVRRTAVPSVRTSSGSHHAVQAPA